MQSGIISNNPNAPVMVIFGSSPIRREVVKNYIFTLFIFLSFYSDAQKIAEDVPIKKQLDLKMISGSLISPDGNYILYSERTTDWKNNRYDKEVWLSKNGSSPYQLTNTENGSSINAKFSPNSQWVSFLAFRDGKSKLFVISILGGEAKCITDIENIQDYKWAPDGKRIALTIIEKETQLEEKEKKEYGEFVVIDRLKATDYSQIWTLDFYDNVDSLKTFRQPTRITNQDYAITDFFWHPFRNEIIYNFQPKPSFEFSNKSNIALLNLTTKAIETIVSNKSNDEVLGFSPDGTDFAYSTFIDDTAATFFANNRICIYNLVSKENREVIKKFDENKWFIEWNEKGLFFWAFIKTEKHLFRLDTKTDEFERVLLPHQSISNINFDKGANSFVYTGQKYNELPEIVFTDYKTRKLSTRLVTNNNSQLENWKTPKSEVISWQSEDGQTIEGVLTKPNDFDSSKKYPLLVILHGGPTSVDSPEPIYEEMYPSLQWVIEGALVLRVNYRGSRGYGEKFRSLNVLNLGTHDKWDILSGINYLNSLHVIDTDKLGCMGWSQGGFISAFLTTNTNVFKAISVGAGISNWVTYYNNTDLTSFTKQYLKSTPQSNPDLYKISSPISNIARATTPTLIQHGEFDTRVPISNAFELYRGLQDNSIPSKLIIYKGFGHWISKPRERMAAMQHNYDWFKIYLFNSK